MAPRRRRDGRGRTRYALRRMRAVEEAAQGIVGHRQPLNSTARPGWDPRVPEDAMEALLAEHHQRRF